MSVVERVYELAQRAARPALEHIDAFGPKVRRGVEGRRYAVAVLESFSSQRDVRRPLVWLHAPSVGETLMAQAILAATRALLPDAQFAFTHFSPSAERVAARVGADVVAYLPWDVRRDMRRTLEALRPNAIAFVRTEIWPTLTGQASAAAVPTALVNAVLSASSSRTGPIARLVLGPAYRRLAAVGAVAEEDAARFGALGVRAESVRVTGDARFDQVATRVHALDRDQPLLRRLADPERVTIVAGSTWPEDDERLVPAFAAAAGTARLRMIVAPHEPDEPHLAQLERTLSANGLAHARLSLVEGTAEALPEVVIVDRIGVLADLYAIADAAYVGGGFGTNGLHSVVEPAALGKPVLFGPRAGNAREAGELAVAGGGMRVTDGETLRAAVLKIVMDGTVRGGMSEAAGRYVASRRGGAERNARLLVELVSGGRR
jgi:3-deoxy-D-manno-octulosonic-acid transferase